ncbi:Eco57I restriction-modification methylase domain-containing protein [Phreatobacter stygius]|uniref:site-specific DNA-methyltransferase (adenine-specific) n=1 Tax=Phreatobacter stygius TaxID=1940610 RepID=A0A4D7BCW6_9HYPH|nr:Eco57I restriction-modification methylase domain-containing protein [Phreatobacter stygius]QCI67216.1 hypothetical protein E8M01_25075 [Phreatobacter stygius]
MGVNARRRVIADDLVTEMRTIAAQHRFFHWEIGFPNVWSNLLSTQPAGGFDAVIGNPPYVRQELLGETKPALKKAYRAYDGMADIYVYFYEQGLRLLRPGGRMSYVVTNKWLKAGYAEALRDLFTDPARAKLEFVADFGHAKHFFPDADVFPSVVVVRKPVLSAAFPVSDAGNTPAPTAQICVIPRDLVPEKGLSAAVAEASYPLPLALFSKESWTLEPPAVIALLEKIRRNGVPMAEYAGVKPYRGVLTGFNEAFLINTATRDQLVRDDPKCADIIKPYLRGQDIERWSASWDGLWMIFARRGIDISKFPSIKQHLECYRPQLEPKPVNWKPTIPGEEWPGRKDGSYKWFEIQDSIEYYLEFEKHKIIYQEIQYSPLYAYDSTGLFGNNKTFLIAKRDQYLLAALNSPLMWWHNWRYLPHMKDEALTPVGVKMESLPIAQVNYDCAATAEDYVAQILTLMPKKREPATALMDWLRVEFGLDRPGRQLAEAHRLDADAFVAVVRAALPKRQKLSAADVARLRGEWIDTVAPARAAADEILALERRLADLVNAAYGLSPDEVKLMWQTAPPRMPLNPSEELRRLGLQ